MTNSIQNLGYSKSDNSEKLFKYMDSWKFYHLLDTSSLYFSKFAIQSDKLENTESKNDKDYLLALGENIDSKVKGPNGESLGDDFFYLMKKSGSDTNFVTCFTKDTTDNYAFWKIYTSRLTSLAIVIDYEKLIEQLNTAKNEKYRCRINYGDVKYFNPETKDLGDIPLQEYLFYKINQYKYETEFRVVVNPLPDPFLWDTKGDIIIEDKFKRLPNGISFELDLKKIIEKIILHPNSSEDFMKNIRAYTQRIGMTNVEIKKSILQDSYL